MTSAELALRVQVNVAVAMNDDDCKLRTRRILHRTDNAAAVWLWPLDLPPTRLRCEVLSLEQLASRLVAVLPLAEDTLQQQTPLTTLTPAAERQLAKNKIIVSALLARIDAFFTAEGINRALLRAIAEELRGANEAALAAGAANVALGMDATKPRARTGFSVDAIERVLARWFHGGRTDGSLLPLYQHCGGPGKPRFARDGQRLGRPSAAVKAGILAASDDHRSTTLQDRDAIRALVHDVIIKAKGTIDAAVQRWHETHDFVRLLGADGTETTIAMPASATLSERVVRHWIACYLGERGMLRQRIGERAFGLQYRPRVERQHQFDLGPGMICQLDETPISDIEIVSRVDDGTILGTMRFYAGVDAVTTQTAGAFMSLRPPSQLCVAQTLLNVSLSKEPLLRSFGLQHSRWDAEGDYAGSEVDWGPDFSGHAATELVGRTKLTWTNVERGRPDKKPSAESIMAILQKWPKWFRRAAARNKDLPGRPKLNQRELALAMLLSILERNASIVPTRLLDDAAIEDGLREPSREAYHAWARARWGWPMPTRHPEDVRLSLLSRQAARISDRGVNVRGLYFNVPRDCADYLIRHTRGRRPAICVVWNDDLIADTWAYDLRNGNRMQLTPLHAFQRFAQLSWPELRALQIEIAIAHRWALEKWRSARAVINAERERAGLSPLGGKRLTSAQPLLLAESLSASMARDIRESVLEYEGERGGLDELCEETTIHGWRYQE